MPPRRACQGLPWEMLTSLEGPERHEVALKPRRGPRCVRRQVFLQHPGLSEHHGPLPASVPTFPRETTSGNAKWGRRLREPWPQETRPPGAAPLLPQLELLARSQAGGRMPGAGTWGFKRVLRFSGLFTRDEALPGHQRPWDKRQGPDTAASRTSGVSGSPAMLGL